MDDFVMMQVLESLEDLFSEDGSIFLRELSFPPDKRKEVALSLLHDNVDVIESFVFGLLQETSTLSIDGHGFFDNVSVSCEDVGMTDEQLYFDLIDEVVDDDLVLLEVLQCDHNSSFLVKRRVYFTVLTFPQLLIDEKVLYRQWLLLLLLYCLTLE